ncbi:MAG: CopG family transcriptional regulator, partial [Ignisphaera sp.]
PFTQKVDDLGRKVAELLERLEVVEERLFKLEETIKTVETRREEIKVQEKSRKSAIEILKEQKVMFEKDIANKIRNRDSFFARLEREGAIVIEAKDERIAVEPSFWNSFVNKLKLTKTNNDDELKKIFDPIEFKLLQKLKESALIVYDGTSKSWNLLL